VDLHEDATQLDEEASARRAFLKQAGKVAATAPAVALLLSAHATPALATNRYYGHRQVGRCKYGKGATISQSRRRYGYAKKGGIGGHRRGQHR
jgi:hypothetical protein